MSARGKQLVLVALFVALALGIALYVMSRKAPSSPGDDQAVRGFWSDDLRDRYGIDHWERTTPSEAGLRLSHLHLVHSLGSQGEFSSLVSGTDERIYGRVFLEHNPALVSYSLPQDAVETLLLPFEPWSLHELAVAPDDCLYGVAYIDGEGDHLFAYDPRVGHVRDLSAPMPAQAYSDTSSLAVASDGRLYGLVYVDEEKKGLFVYDPDLQQVRDLSSDVSGQIGSVVAGADGRIYVYGRIHGYPEDRLTWMVFSYDPSSGTVTPLYMPWGYVDDLVANGDGFLYGTVRRFDNDGVFALDLGTGIAITQSITYDADVLAPRPGGGVYLGANPGLWFFEPVEKRWVEVIPPPESGPLCVRSLAVGGDGNLYGRGYRCPCSPGRYCQADEGPFSFVWHPSTGEFERLEQFREYTWWDGVVTGPDGQIYTAVKLQQGQGEYLARLDLDTYATEGVAQSDLIRPTPLVLDRVAVGGAADEVRALVCGRDGRIFGTTARWQPGSDPSGYGWLFQYDPQIGGGGVEQVNPVVSGRPGGTALVQLDDGRLVGGTRGGYLFVYDPETATTWDVGQPISHTSEIAALALGHDELVYGGTLSRGGSPDERATLFAFDPVSGAIADVGKSLPDACLVGAVAVAEDGRVYAGVDGALAVYDPGTGYSRVVGSVPDVVGQNCSIHALVVGLDGKVYGGCDGHLVAYDPEDDAIVDLGIPARGDWHRYHHVGSQVVALAVDGGGRIYGSIEFKYADSDLFVYDPGIGQLTNLGVAVPKQISALVACGDDNTIYAGIGLNNSYYIGPAYLFAFRDDCPSGSIGAWGHVTWEAETPPGTRIVVDVLDQEGNVLLRDVKSGDPLWGIDPAEHLAIRLRATLFTSDERVTPVLKNWRVDYTFECQQ